MSCDVNACIRVTRSVRDRRMSPCGTDAAGATDGRTCVLVAV